MLTFVHRARFMVSCLYFIQISLFQKQFDVARKNIQDVNILAEYIALLHVPYFLKSALAICAPRHDREFWIDLMEYKSCYPVGSCQSDMVQAV